MERQLNCWLKIAASPPPLPVGLGSLIYLQLVGQIAFITTLSSPFNQVSVEKSSLWDEKKSLRINFLLHTDLAFINAIFKMGELASAGCGLSILECRGIVIRLEIDTALFTLSRWTLFVIHTGIWGETEVLMEETEVKIGAVSPSSLKGAGFPIQKSVVEQNCEWSKVTMFWSDLFVRGTNSQACASRVRCRWRESESLPSLLGCKPSRL